MPGTRMGNMVLRVLGVVSAILAAGPVMAQESWPERVTAIEDKYFNKNQKPEAVADLQDAIEKYRNEYADSQCDRMLALLKEYFGVVSNDINRFSNVVYAMYRGSSSARINRIVSYFEGQGVLYTSAKDARRRWFEPHHAEIKLVKTQIDIGGTTTYVIEAKNDEGYPAGTTGIDIKAEDPTIAAVSVSGQEIRGLRPAKTMVIISNSQGIELDKKEIEVLPGLALAIDPPTVTMTEGDVKEFTVKSNKTLQEGDLSFTFEPAHAAQLKPFPVAPNASEQHVEVRALVPSLEHYRLNVTGPEEKATFATISIMMAEPHKPGMKWQLVGSGVVLGSFLWGFSAQSNAADKQDAEAQCVAETFAPCPEEHQAYEDAQNTANIAWTVTALATAGVGYLWYRYYRNMQNYGQQMNEYEKYSYFDLEISPAGAAVSLRF